MTHQVRVASRHAEHSDDWLNTLLEEVVGCMGADSAMGPLGLRHGEEEGFSEILIYRRGKSRP